MKDDYDWRRIVEFVYTSREAFKMNEIAINRIGAKIQGERGVRRTVGYAILICL